MQYSLNIKFRGMELKMWQQRRVWFYLHIAPKGSTVDNRAEGNRLEEGDQLQVTQ